MTGAPSKKAIRMYDIIKPFGSRRGLTILLQIFTIIFSAFLGGIISQLIVMSKYSDHDLKIMGVFLMIGIFLLGLLWDMYDRPARIQKNTQLNRIETEVGLLRDDVNEIIQVLQAREIAKGGSEEFVTHGARDLPK